jgi:nitrile hydratase
MILPSTGHPWLPGLAGSSAEEHRSQSTRWGTILLDQSDATSLPHSSRHKKWGNIMTGHDPHHDHSELSETELRVRALESILTEKGYIDPAALDELVDNYEHKIGPRNGARVIARAWKDPAFRARLMADATPAIAELGYAGRQGEHIVAVENKPRLHNIVVCTLCSCYPWPVLGLPPTWYKSASYRSKVVKDPRSVLGEFGVALPPDTVIRVWDSTAEIRYLVVPMRPEGTGGWSEEQLADLVTRDSMIGTRLAQQPTGVA